MTRLTPIPTPGDDSAPQPAACAIPSGDAGCAEAQVPRFDEGGCSAGESFALRVLGDDMTPEFTDGDIIIVEPDGALKDGSFVLAQVGGEWLFRQLVREGQAWALRALNPACRQHAYLRLGTDLATVRGVVIQKSVPGRRRLSRFYV